MKERIRVLIVDDHRMFVQGLRLLLQGEDGIDLVGAAGSGEDALQLIQQKQVDVVLMDVDLAGIDGIETTRKLKRISPSTQVVMLTAFQNPATISRALEAGAIGYARKADPAERLPEVIERAAKGEIVLPEDRLESVLARLQRSVGAKSEEERGLALLTSREIEILQRLAEGDSTGELATRLFLSQQTIQSHVKSILMKLGVHSKLHAVMLALRHGVIRLPQAEEERVQPRP